MPEITRSAPIAVAVDYDTNLSKKSNSETDKLVMPPDQDGPPDRPPGCKRTQRKITDFFARIKSSTEIPTDEPDKSVGGTADERVASSPDLASSEHRAGTFAHRRETITALQELLQKNPELQEFLSKNPEVKAKLYQSVQNLQDAHDFMEKDNGVNSNTPHAQLADPMDHMSQTQDRQSKMFEQQMAMQEANMGQQMMMSSWQQISQTVTAFTQAANTETSALCNTIIDCVKAISDLLKKGGAAMDGAVGN